MADSSKPKMSSLMDKERSIKTQTFEIQRMVTELRLRLFGWNPGGAKAEERPKPQSFFDVMSQEQEFIGENLHGIIRNLEEVLDSLDTTGD